MSRRPLGEKEKERKLDIFLDSGAFSAYTQKAVIKLDDYIAFIKKYAKYITVYANLDVIGDAEATLKNQHLMEAAGLKPLPTFHFGEDISYLEYYIKHYDYIALGGVAVKRTKGALVAWLDQCFDLICPAPERMPKVKVHGFGITAVDVMQRYPWYSVDSTAWVKSSRLGMIYVPRQNRDGAYDYLMGANLINVSTKNPGKDADGRHISTFGGLQLKYVLDYIERQGFNLGKSELDGDGKEKIIEKGLCNDYRQRDEFNAKYFLDLEKALPDWPHPFRYAKANLAII